MRADYTYFPFTGPEKLTYKYKDSLLPMVFQISLTANLDQKASCRIK